MTKRILVLFSLVFLLIVASTFMVRSMRSNLAAKTWTIESPGKTYRIVLTGSEATPSWPFTQRRDLENRKVVANITKRGVSIVEGFRLYNGDAYDSNFEDLYPNSEWVSEGILHMWRRNDSQNSVTPAREIVVANESRQTVKYLYVTAGKTNLFFLFDLAVASRLTLPIHLQHWEEVIACQGSLTDRDIAFESGDFSLMAESASKSRYEVVVKEDGCFVKRVE